MSDERPKTRSDLTVVELDGETVVYDDAAGELHHLNQAASIVFSLLDGTATTKELAVEIATATGRPTEEIEDQVQDVVRTMADARLLED